MLEDQRGEASYIFIPDGIAFCAKLGQRSVDVDRIPQHNDIYNESQCTQLVFLAFPIPLEQLALFAVKYRPCQFMAVLPPIVLVEGSLALFFVSPSRASLEDFVASPHLSSHLVQTR